MVIKGSINLPNVDGVPVSLIQPAIDSALELATSTVSRAVAGKDTVEVDGKRVPRVFKAANGDGHIKGAEMSKLATLLTTGKATVVWCSKDSENSAAPEMSPPPFFESSPPATGGCGPAQGSSCGQRAGAAGFRAPSQPGSRARPPR